MKTCVRIKPRAVDSRLCRRAFLARAAALVLLAAAAFGSLAADSTNASWARLAPYLTPPPPFANQFGPYQSLLQPSHRPAITRAAEWPGRRRQILDEWTRTMGAWPALLPNPKLEFLGEQAREDFVQHRVRVQIAPEQSVDGYLLVPAGQGPFPAVLIPYYEPETSVGLSKQDLRDFGLQLARRGFVTLSIGSPGGDARRPELGGATCQPLSFLGYVAANCHTVLAHLKEVDPARIGIVGHSYGGKWAMFGACLYDKFTCGVWSDPGIVFDETRPNINYWDPWYLGADPAHSRPQGLPTPQNPSVGPYHQLVESGHDLTELLALMAPRPFQVSGGSEDPPERWLALNRVNEVYHLLGATNRVALTSRPAHTPTPESNELIYAFFDCFLKRPVAATNGRQ